MRHTTKNIVNLEYFVLPSLFFPRFEIHLWKDAIHFTEFERKVVFTKEVNPHA